MLSIGYNLTQKDDPLERIDLKKLFHIITEPDKKLKDFIENLRNLITIDPKAYNREKKKLPYVVGSLFEPNFRRTENFASSEYLILDFDHFFENDKSIEATKNMLQNDPYVKLIYTSPSGDGIKVFFNTDKKIYDSNKYKIIYKVFAENFAKTYDLLNLWDSKTFDVSRACFISYDPLAYFNPKALPVITDDIINFDNFHEVNIVQKQITHLAKKEEKNRNDLPDDVFAEIKRLINPESVAKKEKEKIIYVPPELEQIIAAVQDYLRNLKLHVVEIRNINYGKKIIVSYQNFIAEVNVFYGKKGFTVVKSPKSGTNLELMDLTHAALVKFFEDFNNVNFYDRDNRE